MGGAAFAVAALFAANAMGGFSGESAPQPTALDELAAAVEALEAQAATPPALARVALVGAAVASPAPHIPATSAATAPAPATQTLVPEAAAARVTGEEILLAELPVQPNDSIHDAVQSSLNWSTKNLPAPAPTTEQTLAQLVSASATLEAEAVEDAGAMAMEDHGEGDHGMMEMMAADPSLSDCTNELKTVASRARVYFGPGSTQLDARSRAFATVIGYMAAKCPQAKVTVEGFADPSGDYEMNKLIALARAENTLSEVLRVADDPARITAKSHMTGDSHPDFCPHYDAVDRRVEFHIEEAQMSLAQAD